MADAIPSDRELKAQAECLQSRKKTVANQIRELTELHAVSAHQGAGTSQAVCEYEAAKQELENE